MKITTPFLVILTLTAGFAASHSTHAASADQCKALTAKDFGTLEDAPTKLTAANVVAAAGSVPAYCRVEGYVAPQVGFEARLPLENWNGKFLFQGCTGMCGTLMWASACDDGVAKGYACATTDMGHRAPGSDGKWAYNNPALEIDVGHRATHVATVAGKAVTAAFYGADLSRAYFRGCSTGGRQGLVEAQRYPYDYDGIIAGAPILYQLMGPPLQLFWDAAANIDRDGKPILSATKIPALQAAVMMACDAKDGLKDGLIDDPLRCDFNPDVLKCTGSADEQCLSAAELDVMKKLYSGPVSTGRQSFAPMGLLPGTEAQWGGYLAGGKSAPGYVFAEELLRYLSFAIDPGPTCALSDFDWARDPQRLDLSLMSAANPDMTTFQKGGGKLIMFHGLADPAATATATMAYVDTVTRTMGGSAGFKDFMRFYTPPGFNHCIGGDGINTIDFLGALEAWVERGQAPDALAGYHLDKPMLNAALPIDFKPAAAAFSRPVYPYPDRAAYTGSGDWKSAKNFKRAKPSK
jgi:hypothetical protein